MKPTWRSSWRRIGGDDDKSQKLRHPLLEFRQWQGGEQGVVGPSTADFEPRSHAPINAVNVLLIQEQLQATTIKYGENGGRLAARTSVAMIDRRPFQGLHRRSPGISFKAGRTEPTAY